MIRPYRGAVLAGTLLLSFALGYGLAHNWPRFKNFDFKPAAIDSKKEFMVQDKTPVILEQVYTRCGHVTTSEFKGKKYLIGKSLSGVRELYPVRDGYLVWFEDNGSLVIYQRIDDWCPKDKNLCHLGTYKGYLAVYKGPSGNNQEVARVTKIRVEDLPEKIQEDVLNGKMEFNNETALNDVLESLDEYE
ncbi:MAG TPA: hypothetical protein GXX39_05980 [Syntrophothermus lipocalidus]|nr:hypothetical protein [Syntrophothermus lipocalidus]